MEIKTFQKLSPKEKKNFLSNEMAERIIRVEQRVSARFGKPVSYDKTEYYKSFSPAQQESFEKYLKNKKKKKIFISALIVIPILLIFFFGFSFTGKVIDENNSLPSLSNYVVVIGAAIFLFALVFYLKKRKSRDMKIDSHLKIIDER